MPFSGRKLLVEVVGDASKFIRSLDRADKSARGFSTSVRVGAGAAAGALTAAFGVAAQKASADASALAESVNATRVVFGDASKQIEAFGKVSAKQAGLSIRQLNQLVTPLGAAFQNTGDSAEEAAKKSVILAKRAADMASVFNVDVAQALEAIQSGLRGEADPLERFGVGLNEAAVKAKALSLGLAETAKDVDANDKAQARYALILEQTNKLAGDFANTSGELANKQRINAAQAENVSAQLGQNLLPVMQEFQKILSSLLGFLAAHQTTTKTLIIALVALTVTLAAVSLGTKTYNAVMLISKARMVLWTAETTKATAAARGMKLSLLGKAGLVGAVGALAFGLTTAILKLTGLDKKLKEVGGSVFDLAASLGLVNDPGAQFKGKTILSPQASRFLRNQAKALIATGLTPAQAAARLAAQHPNVARRDIEVLAGVHGNPPIVIKNEITLDGKVVEQSTTKHQQDRRRRNPPQKRGSRAALAQ